MSFLDFAVETIDGKHVKLSEFQAKAYLVVNTASRCVYTEQYAALELLFQEFQSQGLMVLGFPCNQFGAQEPEGNLVIGEFCQRNYGVNFPMFAKIEVNGERAHPLFQFLKQSAPGILGSQSIKWNFTKFLLASDGSNIQRFAPQTDPSRLRSAISKLLHNASN